MSAVSLSVDDHIAVVTLDRPPVNVVDRATLAEIRDVFIGLSERRDVRVVIFTAAGERAFMGGADLSSAGQVATESAPSDLLDSGKVARDAMWAILDCAVPVIGAINGPAIGAGVAFAGVCDILLAAEHATFGTLEINVGLLGASSQLSLMVGRQKAREMFFLGEKVSAQDMFRYGAIREVVPIGDLMARAMEVAHALASKSPIALRLAKESMNRAEGLPLKEAYRTEQDYTNRLLQFEDSQEARDPYLEKRDPEWKWR